MDFTHPYLTRQLIAYIGNKRKLLPLVYTAIEKTGLPMDAGTSFFDVFAGSGSVSRLAKLLGLEVYSNDWEEYSYVLGTGFIQTDKKDVERLFGSVEAFAALLEKINSQPFPGEDMQYIAKYYAPKEFDVNSVDFKTERLFYTRQNALTIDKIRNYIEKEYSGSDKDSLQKRNILIAGLLYEAATHTNTSGVFKAYHKGFGGHNKDALTRILKPIELHEPELIDARAPVHIFKEDANTLVRREEIRHIDIAYLDPPYNQHQYGSNYHMLNTIALWDHVPEPLILNDKGELKEKAAIRHDWIKTKSAYCYKDEAATVFEDLIEHLDATFILISYSTDGIIPFDTMRDICMKKGQLSIVTNEYTKYRGGKQSNKRKDTNIEFILCIDTRRQSDRHSAQEIDSLLARKKILLLFKQKFCAEKLRKTAEADENDMITLRAGRKTYRLKTDALFEVQPPEHYEELTLTELVALYRKLSPCICETKEEELAELLAKAQSGTISAKHLKKLPPTLKKLASKKNREKYCYWQEKITLLSQTRPELYARIREQLEEIHQVAKARFTS